MVFNATFNNISIISWRSVLLVTETEVPRENYRLSQVTDKLYHIMLYRVHLDINYLMFHIYNVQPEQLSFIFCLINEMREITFYKTLSI